MIQKWPGFNVGRSLPSWRLFGERLTGCSGNFLRKERPVRDWVPFVFVDIYEYETPDSSPWDWSFQPAFCPASRSPGEGEVFAFQFLFHDLSDYF